MFACWKLRLLVAGDPPPSLIDHDAPTHEGLSELSLIRFYTLRNQRKYMIAY